MTKTKRFLTLMSTLFVVMFVSGCVNPAVRVWPEMHGAVLDKSTGAPVTNAYVVVKWIGSRPIAWVDSQTICFHVEVVRTDAQGVFTVPPWHNEGEDARVNSQHVQVLAYKTGYHEADEMEEIRTNDVFLTRNRVVTDLGRYLLEKDDINDNVEAQSTKVRQIALMFHQMECTVSDNNAERLLSLFRLMESDARALEITTETRDMVEFMRLQREMLEFGDNEATRRYLERHQR